jgi:hypothetical protein
VTQKRAHFFIPEEMLAAMDKLAGKGKGNSLVVEILGHEIRRRRLMQILSDEEPILKSEDHPEWKDGSYAWVRELRDQSDQKRSEKLGDWLSPRK